MSEKESTNWNNPYPLVVKWSVLEPEKCRKSSDRSNQFWLEDLKKEVIVPYKGASLETQALIQGAVQIGIDSRPLLEWSVYKIVNREKGATVYMAEVSPPQGIDGAGATVAIAVLDMYVCFLERELEVSLSMN